MTDLVYRNDMKVTLIDSMGNDETIARAARASTGKDEIHTDKIEGLVWRSLAR